MVGNQSRVARCAPSGGGKVLEHGYGSAAEAAPPPSLRGLHEALREALRAEYVVQSTLRQAIDNGDFERAIAVYDELSAAHAKVKDILVGALKVARPAQD
ncbi:MAG: hypothetical protein WCB67_06915 [Solirubrobacteraceae bacterium]